MVDQALGGAGVVVPLFEHHLRTPRDPFNHIENHIYHISKGVENLISQGFRKGIGDLRDAGDGSLSSLREGAVGCAGHLRYGRVRRPMPRVLGGS